MTRAPWICCVRLNDHDKAYFSRQRAGFVQTSPTLIAWQDDRVHPEHPSISPPTTWDMDIPIRRGRRRIETMARRARSFVTDNPFAGPRREIAWFEALAQQTPPSVIYAHTGFVAARLLPLRARLGVPLVAHFHGLDITRSDPLWQRALQHTLPFVDRVLVVGQWMRPRLEALGARAEAIEVLPMGAPVVGAGAVVPVSRRSRMFRFVFVGRLVGCKGVDRTLEALQQVSDAELVVVGDGPLREELEGLAEALGVSTRVRFTGQLDAGEVLSEMAAGDAYVQHALDNPGGPEAFGVTITEAMALAKPVVGTWCGGLPDQIVDGETGYLVGQNDIAAMAEAMQGLVSDPERARTFGVAGQRRALRFDAARLGAEAERLLLATIG